MLGVTDATIQVGISSVNVAEANAVAGAITGSGAELGGSGTTGDGARIVADYINDHGGVAGRKIELIVYDSNVANWATSSGRDIESQQACSYFTEDHHVFAMIGVVAGARVACAQQSGTVLLSDTLVGGQDGVTADTFSAIHDLWYAPNGFLSERRERALVEGLWQGGFFSADARVGILVEDRPERRLGVERGMVPALKAHGIKVQRTIVYSDGLEDPWQNYMLQLQSENVTHLLMSSSDIMEFTVLSAMQAAENQRYRPKWGIASDLRPAWAAALGAPKAQLANASGIGWMPKVDIDLGAVPVESPTSATCDKLRTESGQDSVFRFCESLFFLQFVLDRADEVSPARMSAALAKVGQAYPSAWTSAGASSFSPSRHDGADVYRDLVFDDRCTDSGATCFKYASDAKPLPE